MHATWITFFGLLAWTGVSQVSAHGFPHFIYVGQEKTQYPVTPDIQETPAYHVEYTDDSVAFITGDKYTNPDVICHHAAIPGKIHAEINAGDPITIEWSTGFFHPGPILHYLAKCNGPCETVNKEDLKFFKFQEAGIIHDGTSWTGPDFPHNNYWATQQMLDNGNQTTVNIPKGLKGNYVLRHEPIGLHFAANLNSAQHYPFCVNLAINGDGSLDPSEVVPATEFYNPTDLGLHLDIFASSTTKESYVLPGPPLYNGAADSSLSNDAVAVASPDAPSDKSSSSDTSNSQSSPSSTSADQGSPSDVPTQSTQPCSTASIGTGLPSASDKAALFHGLHRHPHKRDGRYERHVMP